MTLYYVLTAQGDRVWRKASELRLSDSVLAKEESK